MIHELKTHPQYFSLVESGAKKFEVRKNDRNYQTGDLLILKEFVPMDYYQFNNEARYTGNLCIVKIDYIMQGGCFGIAPDYVVMSISHI
jgi:ASC-1-like (ASCH) protein